MSELYGFKKNLEKVQVRSRSESAAKSHIVPTLISSTPLAAPATRYEYATRTIPELTNWNVVVLYCKCGNTQQNIICFRNAVAGNYLIDALTSTVTRGVYYVDWANNRIMVRWVNGNVSLAQSFVQILAVYGLVQNVDVVDTDTEDEPSGDEGEDIDITGLTEEVLGIRIGADGTIYETAGEAVRQQYEALAERLDAISFEDVMQQINDAIAAIPTEVETWLDEHPEATTTVQDGAVTEVKLADTLKLKTIKDYVTPEMFGAVGDGVTDDTSALQSMFDSQSGRYVFSKNYLVTETINVTENNANLCGIGANILQYKPRIVAGAENLTVFSVDGFGFSASGIKVEGYESVSPLTTIAFYFTGLNSGDPLDVDCIFTNCTFARLNKAVITTGRNAQLINNIISQCNTFLHVEYISGRDENRGYRIEGNRFHGCGTIDDTFASYLIEVDSACNNENWYMSVLSNMFDKCYGVIKAPLNGISVIGNSMVEMHGACLFFDNAETLNNGRRSFSFISNSISGFVSPNVNYRLDLAIYLAYSGNSAILSNDLNAMVSCIDIGANASATIMNNKFYDIWFNSGFSSVPVINNAGEIFAINNIGSNSGNTIPPYAIKSTGSAYLWGNKIKSTNGYDVLMINNGSRSEKYIFQSLTLSSTDKSAAVSRAIIYNNIKNCYVLVAGTRCYDISFNSNSGLCVFGGATYSATHGIGVIHGSFTVNSNLTVTYNKCTVTYDDGTVTTNPTIDRFACALDSFY